MVCEKIQPKMRMNKIRRTKPFKPKFKTIEFVYACWKLKDVIDY